MSAPTSPQFVFHAGGAGVARPGLFTTTTIAGKKRGTWTRFSGSSSNTATTTTNSSRCSSNSFSAASSSSTSGPCLLSQSAGPDEHYSSSSSSSNKRRRTTSSGGQGRPRCRCWSGAGMNKLWEKMFGRGVMVVAAAAAEKTPSAAGPAAAGGSGAGDLAVEKWVKGEGVLRRILAVGEEEREGDERMRESGEEEEDVEERENEELVVLREVLGAVLEMFQGERGEEEENDDNDFVVPFCMAEWR